jgi:glycosyltransferase involved in cell wall biosynthesis
MNKVRVLYIHHVGAFGGASRSLYEGIKACGSDAIEPCFLTVRGTSSAFFKELGPVVECSGLSIFDNTRYSFYRGLRWLVLIRELARVPRTFWAVYRARRLFGNVDLIHINESTVLLPSWLAKRVFKAPLVVHARCTMRNDRNSLRTKWINDFWAREADAVIAIDETVRRTLPPSERTHVIHNTITNGNLRSRSNDDASGRLGQLRPGSLKVGFVGNLLRSKGIVPLVNAFEQIRAYGVDAELIIVGGNIRRDNRPLSALLRFLNLEQEERGTLENLIGNSKYKTDIHQIGFLSDLAEVYRSLDILCFPSLLDAPGRPVIEAALFGKPSVVAVRDPSPDTLVDGITGVAITSPDVPTIADALLRISNDRALLDCMGKSAQKLAIKNFHPSVHSQKLLSLYRKVLSAQIQRTTA